LPAPCARARIHDNHDQDEKKTMTNATSRVAVATRYAARGLRVLPIRAGRKEPLLEHGVHDASDDARVIRAWWSRWPDANLAIAVPAEWFVLDVDPRNGGDVELARLQREHGELPPTIEARTGSGGEHRLFARPPGVRLHGKVGAGLDVLAMGRYFVVPPSIHPSGGAYRWTSPRGAEIAQPPAWLVELARVREAAPLPPRVAPSSSSTSRVERARRYIAACPPAISGNGGHTTTFSIAQKLVRGFDLSEAETFSLMVSWNKTCQPPWSARELARKIKEAARAGRLPVGALADKQLERSFAQ
jgi:hypothetical protein